jgi:methylated-DNA-[protein]-cysteine S-methyltransferase
MKFSITPVRSTVASPLGPITLAADATALVGLWFDGQQHQPDWSDWPIDSKHPVLQKAASQLDEYFAGKRTQFDLPISLAHGTAFQRKVWQALLHIAAGQTSTYGDLSQRLGQPSAVRAVAAAIGRNPISVVVPCHRVLGARGALTGYAGGLERKAALLQLESRT